MEGILPLWKPAGMTSHDCVFKVRKILRMKRVGHTGTLDPDVDGVLPICIGTATKVAEYMTESGKEYIGEATLGFSTTTEDASGDVVDSQAVDREITEGEILSVLESLTGEITQTPPMFSAVKVKGKRLYEYARAGIEVERPSRTVEIHELELLEKPERSGDTVSFRFRVKCSKGTYVRTLAVMIGEKLGYPAHMSSLTRTESASFTAAECVTFEQLESKIKENDWEGLLYPLEKGIAGLAKFNLDEEMAEKVKNGAVLPLPAGWPEGKTAMMFGNKAMAIYQLHPEKPNLIKPVKVLRNDQ